MTNLINGLIISYIFSIYILPVKEGGYPNIRFTLYPLIYNSMIIIPFNKKALHIHHWTIFLLIYILSLFYKIPPILAGFSIGLFIQGILYNDRFNFICDNPYKKAN